MNLLCKLALHNWKEDCEKCARCGATRETAHDWVKNCEKCSKAAKRPPHNLRVAPFAPFRHIMARLCLAQACPCDKRQQVARDVRGLEVNQEIPAKNGYTL
jgi:hypothetical protein